LDPKTGRILGTINGNNQQHPTGTTTVVRAPGMPGMRMPGKEKKNMPNFILIFFFNHLILFQGINPCIGFQI